MIDFSRSCKWVGVMWVQGVILAVQVGECDKGRPWQGLWLRGVAVGLGTGHARVW